MTAELPASPLLSPVPPDPVLHAIDGVLPSIVLEPPTPEGVAQALQWAAGRGLSVVIRGAGTKASWGRVPQSVDVLLGMRRLRRVVTHRPGDLTVTVEAGATLDELNAALAAERQMLPLDPWSGGGATIGGLLAANDSGALRHRHGTPRDLVIGVQLATTDGRLVKAGGQVVKNVAGYDLSKLICGSFGSLAAIVSATFKLAPATDASSTLVAEALDIDQLERIAVSMGSTQLEPEAFDFRLRVCNGAEMDVSCLVRFASIPAAVDAQVDAARARLAADGGRAETLAGVRERAAWQEHEACIREAPGAVVRMAWLPADLARVLRAVSEAVRGAAADMTGRMALGSGFLRIEGDLRHQAEVVEALRRSGVAGHVVVVRAEPGLKALVDPWGQVSNGRLLSAIKRSLDPKGTLAAGRGPM